jgi:hypothetical protein
MLRVFFCLLAGLAILGVSPARADDKKSDKEHKHRIQATIASVDAQKDAITAKFVDKNGKEMEKTFQLTSDTKLRDSAGKYAKLDTFRSGDEVVICQKEDKITEVRKHAMAKIVKIDPKAGTVTVKVADKDGKEVERTFTLVEDSEYVDSTGRVAVLDVFRSGDDVLLVEGEGKLEAMKKAPDQSKTARAKGSAEKSSAK